MVVKPLSPREEQIVELAVEGNTNESIAHKLGLSLSTVNTYWVRIRVKVQGHSRTEVISKLIRDKAESALREANREKAELGEEIHRRHSTLLDLNAALALLQLAMDQLRSAVWATDSDLKLSVLANGEIANFHEVMSWETGNTIYEVFRTTDPRHPAVAMHLAALKGEQSEALIVVEGHKMLVSVRPFTDEDGSIIGCIGVMSSLRGDD